MRAIFLDRDGTLVKDYEDESWSNIEKLELYADTIPALKKIPKYFLLFIVTNQYLIQENFITLQQFQKLHNELIKTLRHNSIIIKQTYYCPHPRTTACGCRKPQRGMIDQCLLNYPVNLEKSFVVGNSEDDILLGTLIGSSTIAVRNYKGDAKPDHYAKDLLSAIDYIFDS